MGLIILITRQPQKGKKVDKAATLDIKEETTTRLILEIKSTTNIIFIVDLDSGAITRTETQSEKILNQVELSISQVDKIVLTFEDTPSGLVHLALANLVFITTEGQQFEIIREGKYFDISPIAKKIALLLHKNIENRVLTYGAFRKQAG